VRRNVYAALLLVVVLLGTLVWVSATRGEDDPTGAGTAEVAEACPTIDPSSPVPLPSVEATPLITGVLTILDPCRLTMTRWIIEPGGSIPANDFPPAGIYVESGAVTITLHEGLAIVWPMHNPELATLETASAGSPRVIELVAGDSVFIQNSTKRTPRLPTEAQHGPRTRCARYCIPPVVGC
jgi:hypothetical protein